MARKTVLVCDNCGNEVDEGKGAVLRVTCTDARRGAKQADLCDDCAGRMPGRPVARRGRQPKSATAVAPEPAARGDRLRARQGYRCTGGCRSAHRRARKRGQGRAAARPLSRALDPRREPVLIVPNGSDVDRVERELLARRRRAPRRLDRHLRRPLRRILRRRRAAAVAADVQRALARPPRSSSGAAQRLDASARYARVRRLARCGRSASSTRGSLEPEQLEGELGRSTRRIATSSTGSGCWDRDLLRATPSSVSRTDLDAWHGEPVFAYGFEDLTGAEWALLEALAGADRGHRLASLRAGPAAFRVAPADGRGPRRLAAGPSRSCRRVRRRSRLRRSRTSNARSSRTRRGRRRRSTARSASSRAPAPRHARARRRGDARARPRRHAARAIGIVVPVGRPLRGAARDGVGSFGIPYAVDGELRLARTRSGTRSRRCCASRGSAAAARDLFALPPLAVLRARARAPSTSSRAGCAVAPSRRPSASSRRRSACAARRCPRSRSCATPADPVEAVRELAERMLRNALRPRAAAGGRGERGSTCAPTRRVSAAARRARGLARARRGAGREDVARRGRACRRCARRAATSAGRVAVVDLAARPHAALRRRLRPRARGGEPAAARRRLAVPRRRRARARSTSAGARLERPDPVANDRYLFYTACTRASQRLYLVREAADDDGSPREASPFWHDVRRSSTSRTCGAGPAGGRSRR